MPRERLSAPEARRLALASQGFAEPRPDGEPGGWDLRRVLKRVGLLQIDSVNVLERAHYLPAFSRLGPYSHEALDRLSQRAPRRLFEYWGHEASLIPVEYQPLLRWRMERAAHDAWGGMRKVASERPELVAEVLEQVRDRGPLAASELTAERPRRSGPWWDWSDSKRALEWLFWSGRVTAARRRRFERLYDLPERVLPAKVLAAPTPAPDEAQRELLRIAARSLGVAAERDLRDYFRLSAAEAKPRLAELVEAGDLVEVEVEGWGRTRGYLWPGARIPRRVEATALLGPFDSLIWERNRVERIFGFAFRLEIYVPAPKRRHGYYVLPFLLGDRLVARVDLKADRAAGVLRLNALHLEPGAPAETTEALEAELRRLAGWLGHEFDRLP
ncbi:MAG TPA: crosslink repair DNA glycosylase YcaQ family protein [Solirubrobacterales bacterium]|nr:crosslink repair DNA glycosylase YcaQ family protein [Solirubrobacterales bacterium]